MYGIYLSDEAEQVAQELRLAIEYIQSLAESH